MLGFMSDGHRANNLASAAQELQMLLETVADVAGVASVDRPEVAARMGPYHASIRVGRVLVWHSERDVELIPASRMLVRYQRKTRA